MREKLLKKLYRDTEKTSILTVSQKIGFPYATLYRLVHNQSHGSMRTWEKIQQYYKGKRI